MQVDLTEQERDELVLLLEDALREMPVEIRHTDVRDFRQRLVAREDCLRTLLERLQTTD